MHQRVQQWCTSLPPARPTPLYFSCPFPPAILFSHLCKTGMQVDIRVFQERRWGCNSGVRRADCLRKQQFLDERSEFMQTLAQWLRRGAANLTLHTMHTAQCRNVTTGANGGAGTPAACKDLAANCVNGGKFCASDPDGLAGYARGNGSTVLLEAIRTRCANKVWALPHLVHRLCLHSIRLLPLCPAHRRSRQMSLWEWIASSATKPGSTLARCTCMYRMLIQGCADL